MALSCKQDKRIDTTQRTNVDYLPNKSYASVIFWNLKNDADFLCYIGQHGLTM